MLRGESGIPLVMGCLLRWANGYGTPRKGEK
jgi:hypothetical protein